MTPVAIVLTTLVVWIVVVGGLALWLDYRMYFKKEPRR